MGWIALKIIMKYNKVEIEADTFNQSFGPRRRDDQHAASSLLQAHSFVQPGHAESGSVDIRGTRSRGREAVAGLAAVVLYLQHAQLLVGEVRADLAEVGHDYEPVGDGQKNHVGRLQQTGDAQRLETIKRLMLSERKDVVREETDSMFHDKHDLKNIFRR